MNVKRKVTWKDIFNNFKSVYPRLSKEAQDYRPYNYMSISSELKAAVKSVREAYKAAKADLDSSYEQTYQDEFDKIQSEYKKVKKSSKKKSSSSSKKTSHPLSYYIRK